MKICLTSLDIREIQTKTTIGCHYPLIWMAKIKHNGNTKYLERYRETASLIHSWWECKMIQPFWKIVSFKPLYALSIQASTLEHLSKKNENLHSSETCTQTFITAIFIISKKLKLPKYPSVGEQLNKLWFIHSMKYCLAIKSEPVIHVTTLIDFKRSILPEKRSASKVYTLSDSIT